MTSNPYSSPQIPTGPTSSFGDPKQQAVQVVAGPATCLMVVAGISIACLAIAIPFDVFLLVSGAAQKLDPDSDATTSIVIRTIWGVVILAASVFAFWGARQMKKLQNYDMARTADIVAAIPCIGPCCLLGIPFGIWAVIVLGKPEVRSAFNR